MKHFILAVAWLFVLPHAFAQTAVKLQSGADAGAQIASAIADLPSTGGRIMAVAAGAQAWTTNPFAAAGTKPVVLELSGGTTATISADIPVPSNVTLVCNEGSQLAIDAGRTLTINGGFSCTPAQVFTGAGTVTFNTTKVDKLLPQWWGARADNTNDDTSAINKALGAAAIPSVVFASSGTYKISDSLVVPANVYFYGTGRGSKIVTANASAPTGEMVRLDGDYASISNVWLSGPGQVLNTVNGRRGIWIGSGLNRAATCNVSYARVENMFIDQFIGNAISGDYTYAKILNNDIQNTTDAAIFLQPSSTNNLIQGNTITGSRYSGIDINGSTTESSGITSRVTAAVPQIRRLKAESSLPKTAAVFRPASISSKATG